MNGPWAPPDTLFLAADVSNLTCGKIHIQVSENVHLLLAACRCCYGKLITKTMEGPEEGCSGIDMRYVTRHFIYCSVQEIGIFL